MPFRGSFTPQRDFGGLVMGIAGLKEQLSHNIKFSTSQTIYRRGRGAGSWGKANNLSSLMEYLSFYFQLIILNGRV